MTQWRRHFFGLFAGAILLVAAQSATRAHEASTSDIIISHPWAEPADAGQNTRLHAVIENEEPFRVSLTGITTSVAKRAELRFLSHGGAVRKLESRTIDAEGVLNLGSHHMWIELVELKRALRVGDVFPVVMEFGDRGALRFEVIVGHHSDPPDSPS